MSLAPIDSSTRSSLRSGWRRLRGGDGFAQFAELPVDGAWQVAFDLLGGHSRARWLPNRPSAMVAPVQASGR